LSDDEAPPPLIPPPGPEPASEVASEAAPPPAPDRTVEESALARAPAPSARRRRAPAQSGLAGRIFRIVVVVVLVFGLIGPILTVAVYRFLPPPITWLMVERTFQGHGFDRRWRSIDEMSPQLTRSVIAAEDAKFCEHHGFDFEALQKAMAHNERLGERSGKVRGGSTISQQTAKNVFLWPSRDYVRKGLEAYFTVLIEGLWGKRRIMEVYLNSVEWGPGIYGAEAAALKNFGVGADRLSPAQAARLAAILPSPLKWQAAKPGPYVRRRSGKIGAAAGTVDREGMADCVLD
jgi:monofunctional biosynthetic peptidoglycan transglycosylase